MEVEAKFSVANRQIHRNLLKVRSIAGFTLTPVHHVKMADRYYDTADGRVLDAGYTCRIRTDDKGVLVTLKGLGGAEGAMHRRDEQEVRLQEPLTDPNTWPDGPARTLALSLTGGQALRPLFDLEQDRARTDVMDGARRVAELSLDEVRAVVGRRPAFYYELEIELLPDGTEAELAAIAAAFQQEFDLVAEPSSKFERALAVLRTRGAAVQGRLDEEEQARIRRILNSGNVELSRRAGAVLGWAEGLPTREIVARTGLSSGRIRFWLREWRARRMGIFDDAPEARSHSVTERDEPAKEAAKRDAGARSAASGAAAVVMPSTSPVVPSPVPQRKNGLPTVTEFAAEQGVDLPRARFVAARAAELFDGMRAVHRLPKKRRKLLQQAALLSEVGARTNPERPSRASRDLILAQPLHAIDTADRLVLACIVAFQREKVKPDREPAMQALNPKQRQHALMLAALLQIADGLDCSRSQTTAIESIEVGEGGDSQVSVTGPASEIDARQATGRTGLWRHLSGREVRFLARPAITTGGEHQGWGQPVLVQHPGDVGPAVEIPPLRADEPMSEAGRKVLFTHFLKMLANEAGTRLGEDIEALHDMRVATRRMRAAYRIFVPYFEPETLDQFNKDLRRLGRVLGAVRDLDVLLETAESYEASGRPGEGPSIAPLLEDWHRRRELARGDMLDHLNSGTYARFVDRFRTFLTTPGAGAAVVPLGDTRAYQVRHVVPRLILERYETVRAYEAVIATAPITTYHALRIEFKGLRYALEFFKEVLGSETVEIIKQVTAMQDVLGGLQDAHVAETLIAELLAERAKPRKRVEPVSLDGVQGYLAVQQDLQRELLTQFDRPWSEITGLKFRRALALAVAAP